MAITKNQKNDILKHLNADVVTQKGIVLISTRDAKTTLDSLKNFELRSSCRKESIVIEVCKNSLIQKALPQIDIKLVGQTYLAYLENSTQTDEVTVPKVIKKKLEKEFADHFSIIGSVINGEFYNPAQTRAIAEVPSFDNSMAMIAGALNQITAKIALSINELPASIARGIKAAKAN